MAADHFPKTRLKGHKGHGLRGSWKEAGISWAAALPIALPWPERNNVLTVWPLSHKYETYIFSMLSLSLIDNE